MWWPWWSQCTTAYDKKQQQPMAQCKTEMPRWSYSSSRSFLILLLLLLAAGLFPIHHLAEEPRAAVAAQPVRFSTEAFEGDASVEVRDLPEREAEAAARAALEEVLRLERLLAPSATEPEPGSLAALNARAGDGPQPVERSLIALLDRALDFCSWSERANGPLGGRLFELWGLRRPVSARPAGQALLDATASAGCSHLQLDPRAGTVTLDPGSRLDLWPFATGWAVDRAIEMLQKHGAGNVFVRVRGVRRGLGPGPEGRGWRVTLPVFPGYRQPLGTVWLKDEALAIAHYEDGRVEIAGDPVVAYWNQSTGQPAKGVVAVIAVSELGLDARGLATTMFVTGTRKGQFLLGQIRPEPSVRWLLGTGEGRPLITDSNWMETRR